LWTRDAMGKGLSESGYESLQARQIKVEAKRKLLHV
jgi:hypothetical protein